MTPLQGVAPAKEYVVWMTLPSLGEGPGGCYDTIPGPSISHLEALEAFAYSFDPSDQDTLRAWIDVTGMEGDSVGVAWEINPGTMGAMRYRVRNSLGWSCPPQWFVFAVPAGP